ncbi:MAG: glycoside hydrolase family 92 protein [Bacteroidaceae bacterium]|nr:glycoside hydrolase family 92 protein [Bacteroidaceae bacterium]
MLHRPFLIASLCVLTMLPLSASAQTDYTQYVDPMIGSGGHGHVFVGANVPFGAVQVGPQNIFQGWDWCSGYHYSDSVVISFTHTHLSGTGCADLGDVGLMPYSGALRTRQDKAADPLTSASTRYTHADETARPGYYGVKLANGVHVELTATERVAMHKYSYPHDGTTPRLLIDLDNGNSARPYETYLRRIDDAFISNLDSLFVVEGFLGEGAPPDVSGMIGQYAHGNEPNHHVPYLYAYAGAQWKTVERVRQIQQLFYTDAPDGLCGNEDCGQMSAWHILSALGFYQVNPSNGIFVMGSPLFTRTTIRLPQGKTFIIEAPANNAYNIYIQSARLNGKTYPYTFLTYDDIMRGGKLSLRMGAKPNRAFGSAAAHRPKSAE